MPNPTPAPDVAALRALADAATPGPWEALPDDFLPERCGGIVAGERQPDQENWERPSIVVTDSGYYPPRMNDAAFIAAARTALPQLLDRVEALEEANLGLRAELTTAQDGWGEQLRRAKTLESRLARLTDAGKKALAWGREMQATINGIAAASGVSEVAKDPPLDALEAALGEP